MASIGLKPPQRFIVESLTDRFSPAQNTNL